jgi:hypothetical protein
MENEIPSEIRSLQILTDVGAYYPNSWPCQDELAAIPAN